MPDHKARQLNYEEGRFAGVRMRMANVRLPAWNGSSEPKERHAVLAALYESIDLVGEDDLPPEIIDDDGAVMETSNNEMFEEIALFDASFADRSAYAAGLRDGYYGAPYPRDH